MLFLCTPFFYGFDELTPIDYSRFLTVIEIHSLLSSVILVLFYTIFVNIVCINS